MKLKRFLLRYYPPGKKNPPLSLTCTLRPWEPKKGRSFARTPQFGGFGESARAVVVCCCGAGARRELEALVAGVDAEAVGGVVRGSVVASDAGEENGLVGRERRAPSPPATPLLPARASLLSGGPTINPRPRRSAFK